MMYRQMDNCSINKKILITIKKIWKYEEIKYIEKVLYSLMAYFPFFYRCFRIHDDKSL